MPFSASERRAFVAALVRRGWSVKEPDVWSPTGGLYFCPAHLEHWSPAEMKEVFLRRAERIEKMVHEGSAKSAAENHDVHLAIDEMVQTGE